MSKFSKVQELYNGMEILKENGIRSLDELREHYHLHEMYGKACMEVAKALTPYDEKLAGSGELEDVHAIAGEKLYFLYEILYASLYLRGYNTVPQLYCFLKKITARIYSDFKKKKKNDPSTSIDQDDFTWPSDALEEKEEKSPEALTYEQYVHAVYIESFGGDSDYMLMYLACVRERKFVDLERCYGSFDAARDALWEEYRKEELACPSDLDYECFRENPCKTTSLKTLSAKYQRYKALIARVAIENGFVDENGNRMR